MTTINHSTDYNVGNGAVKVEWSGLVAGDDGQPFDCSGLKLGSVHYSGTFSGGQADLDGSNELSPANFVSFDNAGSPVIRVPEVDNGNLFFIGSIRPRLSGGSGILNVSAIFVPA